MHENATLGLDYDKVGGRFRPTRLSVNWELGTAPRSVRCAGSRSIRPIKEVAAARLGPSVAPRLPGLHELGRDRTGRGSWTSSAAVSSTEGRTTPCWIAGSGWRDATVCTATSGWLSQTSGSRFDESARSRSTGLTRPRIRGPASLMSRPVSRSLSRRLVYILNERRRALRRSGWHLGTDSFAP